MKKITAFLILVCLLSVTLMGCGAVKSEKTIEPFKSEDGRFAVNFIDTPKHETQKFPSAVGEIELHMYMVDKSDIAYIVSYNDYPEAIVKNSTTNDLLVGACNGAIANTNGKNSVIEDITLGEHPGKYLKYDGEKDGEQYKTHQKIYLVGNRLYQVTVATHNEKEHMDDINKFVNSFKLIQ